MLLYKWFLFLKLLQTDTAHSHTDMGSHADIRPAGVRTVTCSSLFLFWTCASSPDNFAHEANKSEIVEAALGVPEIRLTMSTETLAQRRALMFSFQIRRFISGRSRKDHQPCQLYDTGLRARHAKGASRCCALRHRQSL